MVILPSLLSKLQNTIDERLSVPAMEAASAAAALSWFRAMMIEGYAIAGLLSTAHVEAANANLRSLSEAWLQLRFLLKCTPDRNVAGATARAFALLELHSYLGMRSADGSSIAVVDLELAQMRRQYPGLVDDLEARRAVKGRGRMQYWTGMGPGALAKVVQTTLGSQPRLADLYKFLSWDAHHAMAPGLNVSHDSHGSQISLVLRTRQPAADAAAFFAKVATYFLLDGWMLLSEAYAWPSLSHGGMH